MKAYCLGELLVDMIGEENGEFGPAAYRKYAGGAAGNMAVGLSKLGVPAAFLGRVSSDSFGRFLKQTLERYGVDTSLMICDPERKTTLAFVSHDENRVPAYLFYRENSASAQYNLADLERVRFEADDLLYFSSLSLAKEPIRSANFEAARRASAAGACVAFDPNIRLGVWEGEAAVREQVFRMLPLTDILKVNDDEIRFLFGEGSFETLCESAFGRCPRLKLIAVTLGGSGVLLMNRQRESVRVPAAKLDVVDTCGAGDTFFAALLQRYAERGLPRTDALRELAIYANSAAHITARRKGVIPAMPYPNEIEEFIRKYHGGATQ